MKLVDKTEANFNQPAEIISGEIYIGGGETEAMHFIAETLKDLDEAIRGRRAFRRFKDKIQKFDLGEQWFSHRDNVYKRIAIEWCENHNIGYQ